MKVMLVRSAVALLGVSAGAASQSLQWVQVASTGPVGREGHTMAYDSPRQRTVLFGGRVYSGADIGDTWEWNGGVWTQMANTGPSPRRGAALAYDSQHQRTVLFGGLEGTTYRADTWSWDGTSWVPQVLAVGPSAREQHAMVYDSQRGRVVLFGGYVAGAQLNDTWEWNGLTWTAVGGPASPHGRNLHAMAYDSQRGRTVLFGGSYSAGGLSVNLGDTWEWDGSNWVQVATSGPSPRHDHEMAFDSHRGRTVMVGGRDGGPSPGGTWEWDGLAWTPIAPSFQVYGHAMAFDSHRGRAVLFSGRDANPYYFFVDTWELVSTLAGGTPFGAGCGSPALAISGIPSSPPSIGTTVLAALSNVPSPLAFVSLGLSNTTYGPFTLPVTLASIGMPGCDLLQSANVVGEPATSIGPGTASYSFAIPNNAALIGMHVYLQGWAWAPGTNAANIIVSNGLDWQIGY